MYSLLTIRARLYDETNSERCIITFDILSRRISSDRVNNTTQSMVLYRPLCGFIYLMNVIRAKRV